MGIFRYSEDPIRTRDSRQEKRLRITDVKSTDEDGNVVFPNAIDGKKVAVIDVAAFRYRMIEALYIPETIEEVRFNISARKLVVSEDNPYLWSDGFGLYTRDKKKLLKMYVKTGSSYSFPKELEEITEHAFSYSHALQTIRLPGNIRVVGKHAFQGCSSLQHVAGGSGIMALGEAAFMDTPWYDDSDEVLLAGVLVKCKPKEDRLEIGEEIRLIGPDVLKCVKEQCQRVEVAQENRHYRDLEGVLFSKDASVLVAVPGRYDVDTYHVPEGTGTISEAAFKACSRIRKVVLAESATHVEKHAFAYCTGLQEVVLSKRTKALGGFAFSHCGQLRSVAWQEGLEEIGDACFEGTALSHVVLPKTVRRIGIGIFPGVDEVVVYDTIDDEAKPAKSHLDDLSGTPNSNVGWLGIQQNRKYGLSAANAPWHDHMISVRSAETGRTKYKVWMCGAKETRDIYCMLSSSWGKHAEFAFDRLDEAFGRMKDTRDKVKTAMTRLEHAYALTSKSRKMYLGYMKKIGDELLHELIDRNDLEGLIAVGKFGVVTPVNIEKAIAYAVDNKRMDILTYLLEYKNRHYGTIESRLEL